MIRSVLFRLVITMVAAWLGGHLWASADPTGLRWAVVWGLGATAGTIWGVSRISRLLSKLTKDLSVRRLLPQQIIEAPDRMPDPGSLPDYMWYPDDRGIKGLDRFASELVQLQKSLWDGIYQSRMAKDRFKVVLDSTSQALILIDHNRRVVLYNNAAQKTFRNLHEGIFFHLLISDPELTKTVRLLLDAGEEGAEERARGLIRLPRKELEDGRWYDMAVTAIPWTDPSVLLAVTDQTEAEKTRRIRQQFVANAAHELKTPLSSLQLGLEAMAPAIDQLPTESTLRRFFPSLERSAATLRELVEDMLNLNRYEAEEAGPPPAMQSTHLASILEHILEQLAVKKGERTVSLELHEPKIPMDRDTAHMVLTNLIANAMNYSPADAQITIQSTLSENIPPLYILTVTNSGVSIPYSEQEKVFERFYRIDGGRNRQSGGSGLGLSIVKHAVGRWRGKVFMESLTPPAVRVTVELPCNREERTAF